MSSDRVVKIAPSILSANFARLGEEVVAAARAGADYIHVDVMDGHFVPNLTIGSGVVKAIADAVKKSHPDVRVDTHLMIEKPERFIDDFARAGSDLIGVHVEACPHLHRTIQQIKETGAKASVAINPATPIESVQPILCDVDQVLVMTVNPGWGGQRFIESTLGKIRKVRGWILEAGFEVDVQVDGGVSSETIARAFEAGANVFVAGHAIFRQPDYAAVMAALRAACRPPASRWG